MKKRQKLEIDINEMAIGGRSYAYHEGNKIELKGGIKGQKANILIKKVRRKKIEGKILEILEKSPLETNEVCPHFGICGGCSYLSLPYETQAKLKEEMVLNLFKEEEIKGFEYEGLVSSPLKYNYRNKMEYTFGNEQKDGPTTLGMHKKGRSFDIITVDQCKIVQSDYNNILKNTLEFFKSKKIAHYNKVLHQGYMRYLIIRKGFKTGQLMVHIVTSTQVDFDMNEFKDMLLNLDLEGEIVSVLHSLDDNMSDAVTPDETKLIYGKEFIREELFDLKFNISPFSFFQTNTYGAEKLYEVVREYLGESKDKTIFDLYCGTGTISQIVSKDAKEVIGIEIVEEAVDAAVDNAILNGISNVRFIAGDVKEEVKKLKSNPDVIIVDPPRMGIHNNAISDIVSFDAKEIIYVSCNAKTLMPNLKSFILNGYKVTKVKAVDMFPNNPHVEVVCHLAKN